MSTWTEMLTWADDPSKVEEIVRAMQKEPGLGPKAISSILAETGWAPTYKKVMPTKPALVVTRHPALLEFLREIGLCNEEDEVISHVTDPAQVRGRLVIGVLPLELAAEADRVITIPLNVPPELRGKELTLEQVRQYAGRPTSYVVCRV